ncbi:MAG: hypothetical protein JSV01_08395 [Desulfobacterales bacterium]|nr:MAG: hypothetical protein JSV01_08395 [Desulfobacterales bacterium]
MYPALTKLALGTLAVLVVVGLFFAIGIALAAYKSWVRKTRGPEEAESTLTGEACSTCVLSRTECDACPAGIVKEAGGDETEKPDSSS